MISTGGNRSKLALCATLITILGAAGCEQAQEPAQPAAPAPAAAPPAAPAPAPVAQAAAIPDGADKLTHGRYLVETIGGCGNCHTPRLPDGSLDPSKELAGAFVIEEPVFKAYARNITPDMETGIGSWTEDEIVTAVRTGVRPDGKILGPPMAFHFYNKLSDTDAHAIAAYIKTIPAVSNVVPESTFQIPLAAQPAVANVPDVSREDPVKYGEYLAGPVGHCMDCHTTYVMGAIDYAQLGRGGNVYARPFIYDWAAVSANITPHPQAGLGSWTDDEIIHAITEGESRDGRQLLPFMPYWLYKKMERRDLEAIVAYLRSIPPLGLATVGAAE